MEWTQFLIMIVTVGGLFFWSRSESRADFRIMEANTASQLQAIHDEMKDFHGRLCAIEEKNRK